MTAEDAAEVDRQERMMVVGETLSMMSHHINNVIQGVNGGSHLIELGIKNRDLALVAKGWETVSRKQAELLDLMLSLSRLGKPFTPNKSPVDLAELTRQCLDRFSEEFQSEGITVRVDDSPESLPTVADAKALTVAIEHLLSVAMKACAVEPTPSLGIGFEKTDVAVLLRIDYQGATICIDPDELISPARPDERIVGGIELATCRKTLREHRGDLSLIQVAERTCRIVLTLPVEFDRQANGGAGPASSELSH